MWTNVLWPICHFSGWQTETFTSPDIVQLERRVIKKGFLHLPKSISYIWITFIYQPLPKEFTRSWSSPTIQDKPLCTSRFLTSMLVANSLHWFTNSGVLVGHNGRGSNHSNRCFSMSYNNYVRSSDIISTQTVWELFLGSCQNIFWLGSCRIASLVTGSVLAEIWNLKVQPGRE